MKIILNDGTEIQLAEATYDRHYVVNFANKSGYDSAWSKFSTENLSDFKLADDNDDIVKRVLNIRLASTQAIINSDNTITGHFYFSGGTEVPTEGTFLEEEEVISEWA